MALHEKDPTTRFTDRADDYVRYRPGYPGEAMTAVLEGLGPPSRLVAADVGAGTGISARLLAARGVRVIAVEPNEAMRAAATPDSEVEWRAGTAEATELPGASVGLVLCAQAFHWFAPASALREFARILAPGARLALLWNQRDRTDPFTLGYRKAILDVGGEHEVEMREFDPAVVDASGFFHDRRFLEFRHGQSLDAGGLLGRARSASYVPRTGPAAERLQALLAELHARFADEQGVATLRYVAQVFLWKRGDRELD